MIHEVTGDILLSKAHCIAHGIAPNDSFSKGLARSLREKWPAMHKDFRHYCHQAHPKPGENWTWGTSGIRVVNLMTQEGAYDHGSKPGKASLENLNHCLRALCKEVKEEKYTSLAISKVATGVGGLEWASVKALLKNHLRDLDIPVYVYSNFQAGVDANETALQ